MEDDGDPPVVRCAELQRWCDTYTPAYEQMTDGSSDSLPKSPFTFDAVINSKIAYWTGDLSSLDAHAIVSCNNENFSDGDPLTLKLFERAGPELRSELVSSVKGCRTGEAKLTKGYRLAARNVIHTVGPRYNAKYRTAAENALYNCYRNVLFLLRESQLRTLGLRCIHSTRRNYPSLDGAHIGIRTVRRFLEKFRDDVDLIVFSVNAFDRDSYASLLPLYFPRSPQEELYATRRLPADVGNEDGEPVIAERKIRISANPAVRPDGSDVGPSVDDDDNDDDDDDISEVLGTTLSVGQHAFAQMEVDVDKRRHDKRREDLMNIAEQHRLHYERLVKRARTEDFSSVMSRRFLYQSGFSKNGEPVFVIIGKYFPRSLADLDKVTLYAIQQMDGIVNSRYIIVYVHTQVDAESEMASTFLRRLFTVTDNRYRRNLDTLYILHTSMWSRMSLWWWSTFNASDVKAKINYLPGVEYLFAWVTPDQLDLPDFVLKYDFETYGIRYYNSCDGDL